MNSLGSLWDFYNRHHEKLKHAATAIDVAGRAIRMGEAVVDSKDAYKDTDLSKMQKAHRIGTNTLLILSECVGATVSLKPGLFSDNLDTIKDLKIGMRAATGAADFLSHCSRTSCKSDLNSSDYIDVAGTGLSHLARVVTLSIDEKRFSTYVGKLNSRQLVKLFGEDQVKKLHRSIELATVVGVLAKKGPSLTDCISNWKQRLFPSASPQSSSAAEPSNCSSAAQDEAKEDFSALDSLIDLDLFIVEPIDKMDHIPEFLAQAFADFPHCGITNKPIRYPVKVEGSSSIAYFEKSTLVQWFKDHPNDPPSGWPKDVIYEYAQVSGSREKQVLINKKLEECQEEIRSIH